MTAQRPSLPPSVKRLFPSMSPLRRYFAQRVDPLTNLFLVLPLFAVYHLGVLTQIHRTRNGGVAWVGNGMDFFTSTALALAGGNLVAYALGAITVTLVLFALILRARRSAHLHPRLFVPVLLESALYAVLIAGTLGYVIDALGLGVLDQEGLAAQVIASCGAGLHEELVFRMALFGGGAYLLERRMRPWIGWGIALVLSSVFFSAVHYLGPFGDKLSWTTFSFRLFCGVAFALIFRFRGFALAAWTHTLYDILYFSLRHS